MHLKIDMGCYQRNKVSIRISIFNMCLFFFFITLHVFAANAKPINDLLMSTNEISPNEIADDQLSISTESVQEPLGFVEKRQVVDSKEKEKQFENTVYSILQCMEYLKDAQLDYNQKTKINAHMKDLLKKLITSYKDFLINDIYMEQLMRNFKSSNEEFQSYNKLLNTPKTFKWG